MGRFLGSSDVRIKSQNPSPSSSTQWTEDLGGSILSTALNNRRQSGTDSNERAAYTLEPDKPWRCDPHWLTAKHSTTSEVKPKYLHADIEEKKKEREKKATRVGFLTELHSIQKFCTETNIKKRKPSLHSKRLRKEQNANFKRRILGLWVDARSCSSCASAVVPFVPK